MTRAGRAHAIRWGALTIGVLLFAAALYYINLTLTLNTVRRLGVAIPLALLLSGLWHLVRTWAWAWCFPQPRQVSFLRLARVRLAAEAFSYLTLRGIAGEPLKVVLLDDRVDAREATAAVALERLAYMIGTTLIVGVGSAVALLLLPLTPMWFRVFRAFAIVAAVVTLFTVIVIAGRGTYVHAMFTGWDRRFGTSVAGGRIARFISSVERQMLGLVRSHPKRLAVLMTATILSYLLMSLEAWVILVASGTAISPVGALTVETFSRVASFASAFIPANLGALEASSLAAVAAVGIAGGGAALALVRRIRGLFWAGIGLAIYPRGTRRPLARTGEALTVAPAPAGPVLLYVMRDPSVRISPHSRLAGLPLSERIIRAALRAGYARVVVATCTWHVPRAMCDVPGATCDVPGASDVPRATEDRQFERFVRQFGERVIVARDAASWRAALQSLDPLMTVTAVGAGTLVSPALLSEAAGHAAGIGEIRDVPAGDQWPISGAVRLTAGDAADIDALADALRTRIATAARPSGDDVSFGRARLAIRAVEPSDLPHAEFILRRSSYKDTDAKVARFNRRISVPISVALIRTPLTANQLSVMLVAVGFYSGWLFSIGSYWPGVLAGFLSLAASVLDGCDGEIARLKYQESALGCWIETFGDYSYYVAIFVGITVGAVHQTGFEIFYWIGALALTATIVTFAMLIYLRARITNGQPDRLHAVARDRFQAEQSLWSRIIWRISFVATRAAMPYGIMVFALLYILPGIIILAAIGANIYWVTLAVNLRDLMREQDRAVA
ncbi:MAG: flippase-like domain-containing protein [Acidobacteriota bacterium]|nr:flippase-like domain-containing protein [Acidobacteriota bacterium]MDQ3419893.1 flippase-like domain-containing protein [Acidobacteriota bacterium]